MSLYKTHLVHESLTRPNGKTTISVIGAGGTGSHVIDCLGAMNAALIQIGHGGLHVDVYEDDVVEPQNVGRQVFGWGDVGQSKAEVLLRRINRMYGTSWVHKGVFTPETSLNTNVVITSVDNAWVRNEVQQKFRDSHSRVNVRYMHTSTLTWVYWLDIGNGKDFGQFVLGGQELATSVEMFGWFKNDNDDNTPSCGAMQSLASQDLFINRILASSAVNLLWSMIRNMTTELCGGYMDISGITSRPIDVQYSREKKLNSAINGKIKGKAGVEHAPDVEVPQ